MGSYRYGFGAAGADGDDVAGVDAGLAVSDDAAGFDSAGFASGAPGVDDAAGTGEVGVVGEDGAGC
jgi:hypothetical protein